MSKTFRKIGHKKICWKEKKQNRLSPISSLGLFLISIGPSNAIVLLPAQRDFQELVHDIDSLVAQVYYPYSSQQINGMHSVYY